MNDLTPRATSRFPIQGAALMLAALVGGFLLVLSATVAVTADGNEPRSLMNQVTKAPRSGLVADNVRGQVCVYLVKVDKTAENRKSCVSTKQVLTLGKKFEELDAVELTQGVGLFRISRDTRYGVSDGVIFEPINELPAA